MSPRLSARSRLALTAGHLAGAASRAVGRGSGRTVSGRVAGRLAPDLLAELSRGRRLLLVSGTNGKTTTTRYLTAALQGYGRVLTNDDGGNLQAGITQALARGARTGYDVAVLEVDERALTALAGTLGPEVLVLLNLTRDQLDRTGEVRDHVTGWSGALRAVPGALVVANADDPLIVAAVLGGRPDGARVRWVGAGQPWHRDCPLCPRCGAAWASWTDAFRCDRCGLARPASTVEVADGHRLVLDGRTYDPRLGLPGRANVANAAMAAAAADCLGVPVLLSLAAMRDVTVVAGRYLQADHAGRAVRLLLAKNPAGWVEVLDQLADQPGAVVVAVNNRPADGTDTSWLWDVPFEQLAGRTVVAAGEQAAAVSLRLRYADVPHTVTADPLDGVSGLAEGSAVVVANYTAFRAVHRRLTRRPEALLVA